MVTKEGNRLDIFLAHPIDEESKKLLSRRKHFEDLLGRIGRVHFATTIVDPFGKKVEWKYAIREDLSRIDKCHALVVVYDFKTLAVGTWIEVWEAYKKGCYIVLYVDNKNIPIKNIFLKAIVDKIVWNDRQLIEALKW